MKRLIFELKANIQEAQIAILSFPDCCLFQKAESAPIQNSFEVFLSRQLDPSACGFSGYSLIPDFPGGG